MKLRRGVSRWEGEGKREKVRERAEKQYERERENLYVYVCVWKGGRKTKYYSSLKNNRIVTTDSDKDYH